MANRGSFWSISPKMKTVFILTYCRNPALAYGTTLIFKTLRIGFPTADVHVVDNNSVPEVRPMIQKLAAETGSSYQQLDGPDAVQHHHFVRDSILAKSHGTVVFLDPDVMFWENCESWRFDQLLAGRFLPKFRDDFTGCITMPRLHTSFLWIQDVQQLQRRLRAIGARYFDFDPFTPYMFRDGGDWIRLDTGASLYAAIQQDAYCFADPELNAYDHLFCGSHFDVVVGTQDQETRAWWAEVHSQAQGDYTRLRGLWRLQEEYFRKRQVLEVDRTLEAGT